MELKNEARAPSFEMSTTSANGQPRQVAGVSPRGWRLSLHWGRWLVMAVILALAGSVAYYRINRQTSVQYITAPVKRGNVAVSLTATGIVNPVTVVEVGTYVSGPIARWYCDFNARVTVGQLCAQIDPRPLQVTADQATTPGGGPSPVSEGPGKPSLRQDDLRARRRTLEARHCRPDDRG